MRYLIAILFPPLAIAMCGKYVQALVCFVLLLTLIGWPLAAIWAVIVVSDRLADERTEKMIQGAARARVRRRGE